MPSNRQSIIRRRALRISQVAEHPLYLFCLTGEELLRIADISRVSRDEAGKLIGYQRPEVKKHIRNIVDYLDSGEVLFPNSLILALPSGTRFKEVRGPKVDDHAAAGTIELPLPRDGDQKPAWIVDGQQRAVALSKTKRTDFPVPISAFVADDVDLQRDQFLRINTTQPLPRGLITELLPEVNTILPANLAARRAPSALCDILNRDPESPFRGLMRRSSTGRKGGAVIADTTIVQILHDSLSSPSGCLFPYRNLATGETDFNGVRQLLLVYWNGVKETFPDAWGLPPKVSRLMHGAGLKAMGKLMDRLMGAINPSDPRAPAVVRRELAEIAPICHWTSGEWEELGMRWNEIQNLHGHVRDLTNVLLRAYTRGRQAA